MTVTAISGCSSASATYTVDVVDACGSDTLTIDASSPVFNSPAVTYNVRAPAAQLSWTDSAVTSNNGLSSCGTYTWEITLTDGSSAIDPTIFSEGDYTAATKTIVIETIDIAKAASYNIQVKVYYTSHTAISNTKTFTILVQDYCNTNAIITPPTNIGNQVYSIGDS